VALIVLEGVIPDSGGERVHAAMGEAVSISITLPNHVVHVCLHLLMCLTSVCISVCLSFAISANISGIKQEKYSWSSGLWKATTRQARRQFDP